MFVSKGISNKWEAFKREIVRLQGLHVLGAVKGKTGRSKEPCIIRDVKLKRKETWVRYRLLGSCMPGAL